MTSFGELLQLAGTSDPAELFGRAWRLWGSVQRSIEPAAAEGELRSAQALMSILVDAGALSERQLSQAELCRSSVSALLATLVGKPQSVTLDPTLLPAERVCHAQLLGTVLQLLPTATHPIQRQALVHLTQLCRADRANCDALRTSLTSMATMRGRAA